MKAWVAMSVVEEPLDLPMDLSKPVQIVDGSPAAEVAGNQMWWWGAGVVWVMIVVCVGLVAWQRRRNRMGAAARLGEVLARWRGLTKEEFGRVRAIVEAEVKDAGGGEAEEACRVLLLPRHAGGVLDRAWDRTGGSARAELIVLRGKLGVLELREEDAGGAENGRTEGTGVTA